MVNTLQHPRPGRSRPADPVGGDTELGHRFHAGDPDAVRQLHVRFRRPLLAFARRHLFDAGLAEDAVQQTFLQAWRAADRFDPARPLGAWLFQICRRVCIDQLRRRRDPAVDVDDQDHTAATVEGPCLERTWNAHLVRRAVADLPPDTRAVVRLVYLDGWTLVQTAELLGLPVGTVKSRSSRAHRQLSSLLADLQPARELELEPAAA
jgi:RNA polymerase sigma-70 factor (ECF subfamily)